MTVVRRSRGLLLPLALVLLAACSTSRLVVPSAFPFYLPPDQSSFRRSYGAHFIIGGIFLAIGVAGNYRSQHLKALSPKCRLEREEETWLEDVNRKIDSGLGSALLGSCALLSLVLSNVPMTSELWTSLWKVQVGPALTRHPLSLTGWVNEGAMALFFFNVGLEIKRELTEGALASPSKAALPCIAAVGGMVVPMCIYSIVNKVFPGGQMEGMTVPMATDIAFAMGVFSLFKRIMPPSSSSFLLALATADDLGAIGVIAVVFAGTITPMYLFMCAATLTAAIYAGRQGFHGSSWFFVVPGVALWYFMLRAGINADIAGVLVALCVPMRCLAGHGVVERLIRRWTPLSALIILPIFALANCAVSLDSGGKTCSRSFTVPLGVACGLLIGKPLGIFGFTWIAVKLGVATMPLGMTNHHLACVGMLGSIGFTMCLFLIECSLEDHVAAKAKLAVLLASIVGAICSACLMSVLPSPKE